MLGESVFCVAHPGLHEYAYIPFLPDNVNTIRVQQVGPIRRGCGRVREKDFEAQQLLPFSVI